MPIHSMRSIRAFLLTALPALLIILLCGTSADAQLRLTSGANLVASNGTSIVLNNVGLNNSGTITAAGSYLVFTGTTATSISSTSSLGNITIDKGTSGSSLASNVSVANTVQLTSGTLTLNGYDLNLGTTGTLSQESATSYVTGATGGAVVSTATLNNPVAATPGNLGIAITSSGNLGTTTIRRSHLVQKITSSANSIARYYDVQPTNTSGLNATVRFSYLDGELNGLSESGLGFYSSTNNGTTWVGLGATTRNLTSNYVEKTFVLFNARLTLADNSAILPISLFSFTGKLTPSGSELQWITASEQNNRLFEVERSSDGGAFSRFAVVLSQGNSSIQQTYTVLDTLPFSGLQYYRLKQVDTDGSSTYSKVIAVNKGSFTNKIVSVFPVPAKNTLSIHFTSNKSTQLVLQVSDSKGHLVMNQKVTALTGLNNVALEVSQLSAGVYYLSCPAIGSAPVSFLKIN